ncbi:MAG: hypothetical protein U5P41_11405 [Gammaproteobacteria bacterium]|nr:hypothetical protein [Gammaproteobacteria bacterium]
MLDYLFNVSAGSIATEAKRRPRLLEQVRTRMRYLHYSPKTEQSYIYWIRNYILFR